jgi:hypothetical protein
LKLVSLHSGIPHFKNAMAGYDNDDDDDGDGEDDDDDGNDGGGDDGSNGDAHDDRMVPNGAASNWLGGARPAAFSFPHPPRGGGKNGRGLAGQPHLTCGERG